ncbi:MAG: iron-sulfur cluster assembly scaffold protein [Candidatus Syntropharchaeia archaeon]
MAEKVETKLDDFVREVEEAMLKDALEIFTERVVEEAYNPKNVGEIENPDGSARITGPCGDTMQIHLKIKNGKIVDSRFLTDGCGPTIACGSLVTELVKGKTIEEVLRMDENDILEVLGGLPEDNLHCPVLAINTLRAAIEDYRRSEK